MTARPSHLSSDDNCRCRRDHLDVVDIECPAYWTWTPDGYVPLRNPTQRPIGLGRIGSHRVADPADRDATPGALVGSFIGDGSPIDTIRYPNRTRS